MLGRLLGAFYYQCLDIIAPNIVDNVGIFRDDGIILNVIGLTDTLEIYVTGKKLVYMIDAGLDSPG